MLLLQVSSSKTCMHLLLTDDSSCHWLTYHLCYHTITFNCKQFSFVFKFFISVLCLCLNYNRTPYVCVWKIYKRMMKVIKRYFALITSWNKPILCRAHFAVACLTVHATWHCVMRTAAGTNRFSFIYLFLHKFNRTAMNTTSTNITAALGITIIFTFRPLHVGNIAAIHCFHSMKIFLHARFVMSRSEPEWRWLQIITFYCMMTICSQVTQV